MSLGIEIYYKFFIIKKSLLTILFIESYRVKNVNGMSLSIK